MSGSGDRGADEETDSPIVADEEHRPLAEHAFPFPIVGIGGSAGALEAFVELLRHLPADTGMAFVVVTHLAPFQESHLAQILGRQTPMETLTVHEGMVPQPDHVYVIPPNALLRLEDGAFHLFERRKQDGHFLPVDEFFLSLAEVQRNFSIGVVLSGMDGDGAVGMRAIKGEGGFALVQTPESAKHGDMPRASIANEHVDMVLPPDLLARHLEGFGRRFTDPLWRRVEEGGVSADEERIFQRILRLLKGVSGVDFRLYKPSTIRRRVARRMLVHKKETLTEYIGLLGNSPVELRDLQEDILINVTQFFRDPEVFEALKQNVLPQILQARQADQQVRIWVAGCSTGEEVYSIAICLLECLTGQTVEPSIQIIGTDASEENIQKARIGSYAESITNEVSPERLRRFFTKTEKGYGISKRVRDLCIFARQNLCSDPPFSRLDLVTCRNVLIYFGPGLQRQLITTFHYALRPQGFLVLGGSETIREFSDLFANEDRAHKIFVKVGDTPARLFSHSFSPAVVSNPGTENPSVPVAEGRRDSDLSRMADRIILARYGPAGLVVNEHLEILQSRGRTGPFVEMAQGMASLQLKRMMRDSIAPDVTAAVLRSIQDDMPVQVDHLRVIDGDEVREVSLEVLPMHAGPSEARFYLVVFLPADRGLRRPPEVLRPSIGVEEADRTVAQLQHDLTSTKVYLQSLLDERDSKNQELVSANEEIQSANEELQSTNEELETTKEELQSSNEELQTVNDELSSRNAVLTQASNDLSNLLNSVNLPVLMLSNELHIRHFTPQTQKLMSVRPTDIGRPFGDIRLNIAVENLETRLLEVLDTLTAQEVEVQDRDGRWYLLRIRPYRTTDNKIEGLVLVMVDIDQHRRSQQQLRDARDFAASVIASIPLPLVVVNSAAQVISLNNAFCALTGMARGALEGQELVDLAGTLWSMEAPIRTLLAELQRGGCKETSFEFNYPQTDGSTCTFLVRGRPLQPYGEQFLMITFEDVSAHKSVEALLKREGERLASQVVMTARELDRSREELRALTDMLMTSQEEERRRLARELHDDVSQRLALLDMECGMALGEWTSEPETARTKVEAIRARIAEVSGDVRTLSHRLHPSLIEHLGASAALESLLEEFAKSSGMLTSFFSENVPADLPAEVATGLYRIAQGALLNTAKHAGNAHVKLSLTGDGEDLRLEIADSGMGFDTEQSTTGLGLISMKERARLIGATLTVQSAPRQGTRVSVCVPLVDRNAQEALAAARAV
ncbi:MAG TPA: CheR family methyltransferase [Acidobacteriaceae bacterium]|nr:CheR family methyltransferase [Acidobacteriaceae bacterium]